jgi:hypothetical protein
MKAGLVILAALVLMGIMLGGLIPPPLRLGSLAPSTFTWAIFVIALGYASAISPPRAALPGPGPGPGAMVQRRGPGDSCFEPVGGGAVCLTNSLSQHHREIKTT